MPGFGQDQVIVTPNGFISGPPPRGSASTILNRGAGPLGRGAGFDPTGRFSDLGFVRRRIPGYAVTASGERIPIPVGGDGASLRGPSVMPQPVAPATPAPGDYQRDPYPARNPLDYLQYGRLDDFLGQAPLFDLISAIIGQGGRAGMFDPTGGGALAQQLQGLGLRAGEAAASRGALAAQAAGLDPRATAGLSAQYQGQALEPFAETVSQGTFHLGQEREQYARALLQWLLGVAGQRNAAKLGAGLAQQNTPDPWAQLAGGVGGAALGAWLGPGGMIAGAGMGANRRA